MLSEHLNIFLNHLNVIARKIATNNKLSLSQYFTLTNISSSGTRIGNLSSILGLDVSTLTRNINILINRSLVDKKRSKHDRREYIVYLTSEGSKISNILDEEMNDFLKIFINDINDSQRQDFINIIEMMNWKMSCKINEI